LNCFWNRDARYYENSWKGTNARGWRNVIYSIQSFYRSSLLDAWRCKQVKGFKKNFAHQNIIEFEDTGVVILEFENGVMELSTTL
jgi:hypothetical protein